MKKMSLLFSAATLLLSTAMPASAATLLYSFVPTSGGVQRFTFNVDSNPVVSTAADFAFTTGVQNLTIGGVARSGTFDFTFQSGFDGGFDSTVVGGYLGPQLFTGSNSAPTLRTGAFALTDGPNNATGTLTVTTVAAIPEPATWAMMVIGFGLAGSAMRRRRITTRVSYAASHS